MVRSPCARGHRLRTRRLWRALFRRPRRQPVRMVPDTSWAPEHAPEHADIHSGHEDMLRPAMSSRVRVSGPTTTCARTALPSRNWRATPATPTSSANRSTARRATDGSCARTVSSLSLWPWIGAQQSRRPRTNPPGQVLSQIVGQRLRRARVQVRSAPHLAVVRARAPTSAREPRGPRDSSRPAPLRRAGRPLGTPAAGVSAQAAERRRSWRAGRRHQRSGASAGAVVVRRGVLVRQCRKPSSTTASRRHRRAARTRRAPTARPTNPPSRSSSSSAVCSVSSAPTIGRQTARTPGCGRTPRSPSGTRTGSTRLEGPSDASIAESPRSVGCIHSGQPRPYGLGRR